MKLFSKVMSKATGTLVASLLATSAFAEDKVSAVHAFPGFLV